MNEFAAGPDGGQFSMVIDWHGGARGVYRAVVGRDGSVMNGRTHDAFNHESSASWSTRAIIDCD